ncbi:putative protein kinase RLK-Pelle-CrRLK1L-1 family [Helianthus debilis subsp. tardiflorus]
MYSAIEEVKHLQIHLQDMLMATNGFAKENLVANGGFGKVYRGVSGKHGHIAVKRLDRGQGQGDHEFKTEIALLSKYEHENIVSLLGFCDEDGEKILVYRYENHGSLDKHLNNKDLTWIQRLQISLDAASGLKYLHDDVGPQHRIIHRDVKSSNILLDDYWKAKISDFGLSRVGPASTQSSFLISNACGTPGYIDPDYLITGYLTEKSDVYSFGVVLLEVLCGRHALVKSYKDDRQCLTILVQKHYMRQTLDKIIPSYLHKQINKDSLFTFSKIAYQCLKNGEEHPTMKQVVDQLQHALSHQLSSCISHQFQFSGGNVTLISNMDAWDQKLSEAKSQGKIVIANFSASWCGVCRSVSPYYIVLSEKHPSLMFLTVNVDKLTKLSIQWNLKVTPTYIFLRDGQQIDKLEGANNRELQKKIQSILDVGDNPNPKENGLEDKYNPSKRIKII